VGETHQEQWNKPRGQAWTAGGCEIGRISCPLLPFLSSFCLSPHVRNTPSGKVETNYSVKLAGDKLTVATERPSRAPVAKDKAQGALRDRRREPT
jgi:hypothetical protein